MPECICCGTPDTAVTIPMTNTKDVRFCADCMVDVYRAIRSMYAKAGFARLDEIDRIRPRVNELLAKSTHELTDADIDELRGLKDRLGEMSDKN